MSDTSDQEASAPFIGSRLQPEPLLAERGVVVRRLVGGVALVLLVCAVTLIQRAQRSHLHLRSEPVGLGGLIQGQQQPYGAYGAGGGYGYGVDTAELASGAGADPQQAAYAAQAAATAGYQPQAVATAAYQPQAAATASYSGAAGYQSQDTAYGAYAAETTLAPYAGPLEFSNGGGPETVAGTKLVAAGADDLGTENEYTHEPEPTPPPSYMQENPPLTLMLYRAQSDENYPMRNVNVGDLAGVMWYLHNEIVGFPDPDWGIRHFNITRIVRFKAVIWNPQEFFSQNHRKFGPYTAYNAGRCTADNCDMYSTYGATVGCQIAAQAVANYASLSGGPPVWVSLPGPCPTHEYGAKTPECIRQSPGGDCGVGRPITGAKDCSFFLNYYGQVRLDALLPQYSGTGRVDYKTFSGAGGREYDPDTDQGTYNSFWDGIHDAGRCGERMQKVLDLFDKLWPQWTEDAKVVQEAQCDGS